MVILEIILVIIGLIAVVLSFKVSDYGREEAHSSVNTVQSEPDAEAFHKLSQEAEEQIRQTQEEAVMHASDELSRLSNEKIMGMDEYSGQVIERIEKNHEEVVFLYNMLNEKEEEIKKMVHHADLVKAQFHEEVSGEYQNISDTLERIKKEKAELAQMEKAVISKKETQQKTSEEKPLSKEELQQVYEKEVAQIEKEEAGEQQYFPKKQEIKGEEKENHNSEILDLYKKGHSILEISRMLSLGQGEVKFVIDLYDARVKSR